MPESKNLLKLLFSPSNRDENMAMAVQLVLGKIVDRANAITGGPGEIVSVTCLLGLLRAARTMGVSFRVEETRDGTHNVRMKWADSNFMWVKKYDLSLNPVARFGLDRISHYNSGDRERLFIMLLDEIELWWIREVAMEAKNKPWTIEAAYVFFE